MDISKVWEHYNRHSIITSKQHGFRWGMSCETQLLEAIQDWTEIMDKGQRQVDIILLDFSKAFDMVPHERLLLKLKTYGITGNTNNWIRGFLTSRTHEVIVNGSKSNRHQVTSGVPQGTVLGPLLFLTYINDIELGLQSTIRLFADDSAIYREINSVDDAIILQQDLFKLQEWTHLWQMSFNVKKCKALRITRKTKNKVDFTYCMSTPSSQTDYTPSSQVIHSAKESIHTITPNENFTPLEEISQDKYLGVILDNKLSFNHHIDNIVCKATRLLNLCRRNLYMCPMEIKETAYKTLVLPHLSYASAAWSPFTAKNINKVEQIQRRAARFVLGNYTYGTTCNLTHQMSEILKWPTLQHRRAAHDVNIFFKILNNQVGINLPSIVKPSPRHPTRFLHIQATHSEAYRYSFFPRTIRLWNQLPVEIKQSTTYPQFKSQSSNYINTRSWIKINNTWTLY